MFIQTRGKPSWYRHWKINRAPPVLEVARPSETYDVPTTSRKLNNGELFGPMHGALAESAETANNKRPQTTPSFFDKCRRYMAIISSEKQKSGSLVLESQEPVENITGEPKTRRTLLENQELVEGSKNDYDKNMKISESGVYEDKNMNITRDLLQESGVYRCR